ncbi:amidohydrolase family protein [Thermogutta sp.]|uniref:amidohydrolase family protein n=1 Tax=Thermogutta sp. TaxID=1962930 RepID=UPI00322044FE
MTHFTRRETLKVLGSLGTMGVLGSTSAGLPTVEVPKIPGANDIRRTIFTKVWETPLIDSHEHLPDEQDVLRGPGGKTQEQWTVILHHYLDSDLRSAGMTRAEYDSFFQKPGSPEEKWRILAPYWSAVRNTGYGLAVRIAMKELYGIEDLSKESVLQLAEKFESTRRPGFYRRILCDLAKIDSCQVNTGTFHESRQPLLLLQDISIVGMFAGPNLRAFGEPTGIQVTTLSDWYRVIDWWFDRYSRYAVAVKSQNAYSRNIDYEKVPQERAEPIFAKRLRGEALSPEEQKALEDHLFWYAVQKATENDLPVKLHTGYYAGDNYMPLSRLLHNAAATCDLCRLSPETRFVFMHICYPYYEELISVAKHYTNAYVDMCWSWIINPVAAKDFLKKFLVTAPANKIFTFGGDYRPVEPVLGHALIARHGIALALCELVEEGWLSLDDALQLVDPIMHENARRVFRVAEKKQNLRSAPWFTEK